MKYQVKPTNRFRKDFTRIKKRGYDIGLITYVIKLLANHDVLPEKYEDHNLSGNYNYLRECHITSDWLLIYEKSEEELILYLTRTGTHSDLF